MESGWSRVAGSLAQLVRFGIGREERERLGFVLGRPDDEKVVVLETGEIL